jgi:hypothetical protein
MKPKRYANLSNRIQTLYPAKPMYAFAVNKEASNASRPGYAIQLTPPKMQRNKHRKQKVKSMCRQF